MNKSFIMTLRKNIVLILCLFIILIAYLFQLDKYNLLYHLGDEFGYWADAAYLYGYDWSGVTSHNTYYSFGYSFVLAPLFNIENFELRYKMALVANGIFQIISFLLLRDIAKRIFNSISNTTCTLISLCITLYTSNIFFSKTTLCESFLYCVFIVLTFLIIRICESGKWIHYTLLSVFTPLIFAVHMRALGVALSIGVFLLLEFIINKTSRKKIVVTVFFMCILFLLVFIYKEHLIHDLYSSNETVAFNDFSGQTERLKMLVSIKGILLLIRSIIGKIYYLLSASFLIFAWSLIWLGTQINIKGRFYKVKILNDNLYKFSIFLLFVFISTLGISSIYMIAESEVIDNLIYGRYNEFILGPFLLIGCCYLFECRKKVVNKWIMIILFYFLSTFFIIANFDKIENPIIREVNIVGVAALSYNGQTCLYDKWEIAIALKSILVSALILRVLYMKKENFRIIAFIIAALLWFHGGIQILDYQLNYRNSYYTNKNIADYLIDNDINEITYLVNNNYVYFDSLLPDILQYMVPTLHINYKNIENISLNNEQLFFVKKERFDSSIFSEHECVAASSNFELYIK